MQAKLKEMRDKQTTHLQQELAEKQRHYFDLRSQGVTEKLEDPSQLLKARREIARIQTILRERELEAQAKNQPSKGSTKEPTKQQAKQQKKQQQVAQPAAQ